jgi:hypothetical protein
VIMQSIIIAERRFIKPMIGWKVYNALVDAKNQVVTSGNMATLQADLNAGRGADRDIITLVEGDMVNSDTYLDATQLAFWQNHLHKITAECVYFVSLPVNRARFTSQGMMKNNPETITESRASITIDLKDLKHLMDRSLQDRISPLIEDMHIYLCRTGYPQYDKDCACNSDGDPYRKKTDFILGMYDDNEKCGCSWKDL